jgi:hypothetical protein
VPRGAVECVEIGVFLASPSAWQVIKGEGLADVIPLTRPSFQPFKDLMSQVVNGQTKHYPPRSPLKGRKC